MTVTVQEAVKSSQEAVTVAVPSLSPLTVAFAPSAVTETADHKRESGSVERQPRIGRIDNGRLFFFAAGAEHTAERREKAKQQ